MAKKKTGRQPAADDKGAPKKAASHLSGIQPPAAPAVMHSEEIGAPVGQDQAIREKLRLYPLATVNEIVGMFEMEGVKVTPAAVKKAKDGAK